MPDEPLWWAAQERRGQDSARLALKEYGMDFRWTGEQIRLRQGAVDFAQRRLAEGVIERDREALFSCELWDACAEFGLQRALIPEQWNGAGQDLLSTIAVFGV